MIVDPLQPGLPQVCHDLPADAYHGDRHSVSHSQAEDFLDHPALFHGRHVTGTIPRKTSPDLEFGSLFDAAVFDPQSVVEIPPDALSASGAKAGGAWKQFAAEHAGKTLLKPEEYAPIKAMLESVYGHRKAREYLEAEGPVQQSVFWTDGDTGLRVRCRFDKAIHGKGLIADVKTARSAAPRDFAAAAWNYGYARQQDWYVDGATSKFNQSYRFVFIVVCKTPPYICECYDLDESFIALAQADNRRARRGIADGFSTGVWRSPTADTVVTLSPPTWAKYEKEWSVA